MNCGWVGDLGAIVSLLLVDVMQWKSSAKDFHFFLFLLLYCRCAKVLLSQLVVRFLTTLHCLCTWMVSMSWVPPPWWSTRPKKGNTPSLVRTKVFFCLSNLMKPFSLPSDLDFLQFLMRLVLDRPRGGLCHLWWVLIKRLCLTLVVDCHIKKSRGRSSEDLN